MENRLISLIIPVYNEQQKLYDNVTYIKSVLTDNKINYEIILIDDGSKDKSWETINTMVNEDTAIKGLKLSRNFGKESALTAGINEAKGDACITMDSDLQHPPTLIPEMIKLWKDESYDVIDGIKKYRGKEKLLNKICAVLFYDTLKKLSGFDLNKNSDFKLLDRKVIESWKTLDEKNTFFRGLSKWLGYRHTTIPFEVGKRSGGETKWSIMSLFKLAITAITSFSSMPLYFVTYLGVFFLLGAIILGLQTLYNKISGLAVSGFTTVILLQLIIGSSLMISLGVIGLYVAKIFDEVKNRPRYIITQKIGQ